MAKTLEDYLGSDPDFTGGMDSVAYVRAGRGGDDSEEVAALRAEVTRLQAIEDALVAWYDNHRDNGESLLRVAQQSAARRTLASIQALRKR